MPGLELKWSCWTMNGQRVRGWGSKVRAQGLGHFKPVSALRDQTARNSSFLPVVSPMSRCEGPLDSFAPCSPVYLLSFPMAALSPPLSLMALAVLLQWSRVALSSFVAFTAVCVEMVPTAPFHLVFSLSLLMSFQNFIQGEISNEFPLSLFLPLKPVCLWCWWSYKPHNLLVKFPSFFLIAHYPGYL